MPTYNAEKWVVATIDNLAAQTYPHIELIVVDDGSRDATVTTVREKLSSGFPIDGQIIELGANAGPSAARNIGLRAATGSWVQFLDSDDFLAPTKFERQMRHCLSAPSDVSAVYSAWRRCYYDAEDIVMEGDQATPREPAQEPVMCLVGIDRPLLGSGIVRRAALQALGGFDESLRFWECEEMFARLAHAGRLEVVASSEPFYLWRMHRDKIYIGDDSARYRSTAVALSWMELVRKQTSGRLLDELRLTSAERAKLLDDCTVWARILYSRDRPAFRQFVAMAKQLQPSIAPTHPRFATLLSRVLGYEAAEGVARLGRIPRALKNKAFGRRATTFDWK
jgi:glycosyltransferase involved in cell wall biosynthesis